MRTYGDPRFDSGRGRNDGAAMYARRKAIEAMPVKPLRQQRVHQIGFAAQYGKKAIAPCFQRFIGGGSENDSGRGRLRQLRLQPWIGQEADFVSAGGKQGTQTPYTELGFVFGFSRYAVRSEEPTSELQSLMRISY